MTGEQLQLGPGDDEVPAWRVHALSAVEVLGALAAVVCAGVALVVVWRTVGRLPVELVAVVLAFLGGAAARLALDAPRAARRVWELHRTAHRRVLGPPATWAGPRWATAVERAEVVRRRQARP